MKKRKYKKVSCHTTVTAAKAAAKRMRAAGKTATVKKGKKGACVYSAGKSKIKRKK
jgi:sugar/nucleoside kinase (ribokinase family)